MMHLSKTYKNIEDIYYTCIAEVLTSNFLNMANASSNNSLLIAILAMSGAS